MVTTNPVSTIVTDMAMTNAEKQQAYRIRNGAVPRGPLKPCGTTAAARRHRRRGEPVCDLCREADRVAAEAYNARRKSRQAEG